MWVGVCDVVHVLPLYRLHTTLPAFYDAIKTIHLPFICFKIIRQNESAGYVHEEVTFLTEFKPELNR
jgi:hypothetical protein